MTREIELLRGEIAIVDDDDYERVSGYRWYNGGGYARARNGGEYLLMHRMLVGAGPSDYVDHKNRQTLDNRKENLRICTHAENMRNRKRRVDNTSGFKGVCLDPCGLRPWRASIQVNGRRIRLGRFERPEAAYAAYCLAAQKYHGDFARAA